MLADGGRSAALFLGPTLSRWAYVLIAYRAVPARPGGLGSLLVNNVFLRELAVATGISLSVSVLCGGIVGLLAVIFTLLWVLRMIAYCTVRLGGVTGDIFGAVGEIVETATFCLFAVVS
jgi:adenosylcobinamide-GDP ribazoletransferase